ncbi:MAG: hypothetical protein WCY29_05975 [Novosphingobium sp.]
MNWPFPPRPFDAPRMVRVLLPIVGYAETGYVYVGYEIADWSDAEDEASERGLHDAGRDMLGDFLRLHAADPSAALCTFVTADDGALRRVVIDILPYNGQDFLF